LLASHSLPDSDIKKINKQEHGIDCGLLSLYRFMGHPSLILNLFSTFFCVCGESSSPKIPEPHNRILWM
jgi:hypothetical protein